MTKLRSLFAALAFASIGFAVEAQPYGQTIQGWDYANSKAKVPNVSSSGALFVTGAAAGGSIFGTDPVNSSPSVAPVNIACINGGGGPVGAGTVSYIFCDSTGHLVVSLSGGTIAATQSGAWSVGQTGAWSVGQTGTWTMQPGNTANTTPWLFTGNVTAADGTVLTNTLKTFALGGLYNGSTVSMLRSIVGASTQDGVGVAAVGNVPNSNADVAITPIVSAALESNHVLKASAGNFYRGLVSTSSVGGWLMTFNATSAPVDGAVTPIECLAVGANSSAEIDHSAAPDRYSTGITIVFSTTGCFTKTASATAFFKGSIE